MEMEHFVTKVNCFQLPTIVKKSLASGFDGIFDPFVSWQLLVQSYLKLCGSFTTFCLTHLRNSY